MFITIFLLPGSGSTFPEVDPDPDPDPANDKDPTRSGSETMLKSNFFDLQTQKVE